MIFKGKKPSVRAENAADSEMLRRFKSNPLVFIGTVLVLVIVIAAFVLVPAIAPGPEGGGDLTFGSYDKVPIQLVPGNYFAQEYTRLSQQLQASGEDLNQFASYGLWQQAFQMAVLRTAILLEMKKAGYTAPAETVDREVAKKYQVNGRFSKAAYDSVDSNARLAEWRQTRDDIAVSRFYSDLLGVSTPQAAAEFMGKMAAPQRTFEAACFPVDSYPDTELVRYGQEHADLFRTVHLSKITISSSEREARQILASIKDGTSTFEDAAKTHSQDSYAEKGGDMGIKAVFELTPEIPDEAAREKVAALAQGEYSDVIVVDAQWAFFRVEEAVKPADFSDAATLTRVRSRVQDFDRGLMENWAIEQAQGFVDLVKQSDFTNALAASGIARRSFGPISLNFGDVNLFTDQPLAQSIPELSGSAVDESFWKTAFSTPVNAPSQPLVQGGNVLVLFPTSETAAESSVESIKSSAPYWLIDALSRRSLAAYFLSSDKMEDRFMETFLGRMMPRSN